MEVEVETADVRFCGNPFKKRRPGVEVEQAEITVIDDMIKSKHSQTHPCHDRYGHSG
jgi:hypothetical protein